MTTSQLHYPQSYSQHLHSNNQRQMFQVYIVKEAPYLELSMLDRHQPWNMTSCSPMSSTDLPITYKCTRNMFLLPQDSHWCITMTLIVISSNSTHLESKIIFLLTFISNSITSMEYTPRKLIYSSSRETMTFHLSSRYDIKSN